jgi:hypothetical protein
MANEILRLLRPSERPSISKSSNCDSDLPQNFSGLYHGPVVSALDE